MKNLRFILIGAVAGGAFGAKIGGYLARVLEGSISYWIESGFIYGMLCGTLMVTAFLVALSAAGYQKQSSSYQRNQMASA